MAQSSDKTAPSPQLQRFEIKSFVERIGLPYYILWMNSIVFFGAWGGFAFIISLHEDPLPDNIWVFAGSFVAGLLALIALVVHFKNLLGTKKQPLVLDETSVQITAPDHAFNFGMLDFILWDQDYRTPHNSKPQTTKMSANLIVSYRIGTHFENGLRKSFVFRAETTVGQMADLQNAYMRLMLLLKSRRKFQRDNAAHVQELQKANDIMGLSDLLKRLTGPSVLQDGAISLSDDPRDQIHLLYSDGSKDPAAAALKTTIRALNSKPVTFVADVMMSIAGGLMTVFNIGILFALL